MMAPVNTVSTALKSNSSLVDFDKERHALLLH